MATKELWEPILNTLRQREFFNDDDPSKQRLKSKELLDCFVRYSEEEDVGALLSIIPFVPMNPHPITLFLAC